MSFPPPPPPPPPPFSAAWYGFEPCCGGNILNWLHYKKELSFSVEMDGQSTNHILKKIEKSLRNGDWVKPMNLSSMPSKRSSCKLGL
jgi:hypothetical protein